MMIYNKTIKKIKEEIIMTCQNHLFKSGERAVILLHAYSGSPNDVRMMARFLEGKNYTVYTPCFTGHQTKDPEDIVSTPLTKWEEDVTEAVNMLRAEGYQKIAILGLSMGGLFAVNMLTKNNPHIIGGGSFSSPVSFKCNFNLIPAFSRYTTHVLNRQGISDEDIQKRLIWIQEQLGKQQEELKLWITDVYDRLAQIEVPTYLAQSGQDELLDAKNMYDAARMITKSHVWTSYFPKSSHVITVGVEHRQLEEEVYLFLESLDW